MIRKITTAQAADVMGIGPQTVRVAMQLGKLDIGEAFQVPGSSKWTYIISPGKLAAQQGISVEELEMRIRE